jgi:hypothetical protein
MQQAVGIDSLDLRLTDSIEGLKVIPRALVIGTHYLAG